MSEVRQRQSERVHARVPVEVWGTDVNGEEFMQRARTEVVSRYGANIVMSRSLAPEQEVTVRRVGSDKEARFRVIGLVGVQAEGSAYGMALVEPGIDFWDIDFSLPSASLDSFARVLLQCASCMARAVVDLNETEIEVFTYSHFINRPCKRCSAWTHWKQAPDDLEPKTESAPPPVEVEAAVAIPKKPLRKHARTRLKAVACIRQFGHEDEIVEVSDISRGGFRFASLKTYPTALQLDVAVPYLQHSANIFIPARVVWSRRSGTSGMTEYGAEYVRASGRPEL